MPLTNSNYSDDKRGTLVVFCDRMLDFADELTEKADKTLFKLRMIGLWMNGGRLFMLNPHQSILWPVFLFHLSRIIIFENQFQNTINYD